MEQQSNTNYLAARADAAFGLRLSCEPGYIASAMNETPSLLGDCVAIVISSQRRETFSSHVAENARSLAALEMTSMGDSCNATQCVAGKGHPDEIFFAAELAKTPQRRKIMRRLLRDIADGRTLGDTTTLADPAVVAKLKEQYEEE